MPWLFLKYGLPLVAGLYVIWLAKTHLDEHQRLQHDNVELQSAVEAKDAVNTLLRSEIVRRDSILARRDVAYRKLSERVRLAESAITQANDSESIGWRNTRVPDAVLNIVREASNETSDRESDAPRDVDSEDS